ncbi:type III-B CRISPR module RAMP protein Cmr4 [Acidithiobacillus caldus]|jgi:CRISPR-associated protein Cmr4|uniref:Type III-B CRISPR module RAMP protein Cmr4 n=1 Tax=Acidithiobacillus caldus TaxID=33059 RepID=A0A1E7YKM2_9PROT|nr:type III-B CRISPR module RAMP protein Cmr4 [Acidithiobacillus caldus]OFC30540.1 type III-B CRISPR module RAMP protein Cmr4 [Acidithiobacillus caldus]OFC36805.1 type III-B CRISPR module RAMP protein Cmr4 [Acidithiobacillus caldus]OFC41758.1 type III-B CRISPR module RAMP protein Cmr4 [Acidithiobacillus caldus]
MKTSLFHMQAISPVHVGVGQAIGVVDLPIARERAANLPMIPGSAIKGVLRDSFAGARELQKTLFGPDQISKNEDSHAGALVFGDALLLVLPVRSLVGMVSFVTSPFLLSRYQQMAKRCGQSGLPNIPDLTQENNALVTDTSRNITRAGAQQRDMLILEDLDLFASKSPDAEAWSKWISAQLQDEEWQQHFHARFAIVSDAVLGFLADTATEIRSRIRIDDDKRTVAKGALWYEENLPAESILFGLLGFDQPFDGSDVDTQAAFLAHLQDPDRSLLQIGGKASIGRGLIRILA